MTQSKRISYLIMVALLVAIGWFHIGTMVLTAFFGYFALQKFSFGRSKILGAAIYLISVAAIGYGLFFFSSRAYKTLPEIAEKTIPAVVGFAERKGIELPFTDYASLKSVAIKKVREKVANVGHYAQETFFQLALLVIGLIVALSLFLNTRWNSENDPNAVRDSVYATVVSELVLRFETFYLSFAKVMGAQIIISGINTVLTAIFLFWNGFPYTTVLIVLTFLCGLIPIIGNILCNTLIVCVGFTISPNMALAALIFLIVIHKLEYFLNSKIIGDRIKNPMWLTLVGIVLGEKLMGIPGVILAPVVLHYIKVEASRSKLADVTPGAARTA
ncbi:MAG TPA: AI-2E family transporter [Verrucomicrobiae bacterium]|jgi:predicted PurR-regulated permease PerM|nr:AI-2E family transporter [Verrucomicrobiae bacterium]